MRSVIIIIALLMAGCGQTYGRLVPEKDTISFVGKYSPEELARVRRAIAFYHRAYDKKVQQAPFKTLGPRLPVAVYVFRGAVPCSGNPGLYIGCTTRSKGNYTVSAGIYRQVPAALHEIMHFQLPFSDPHHNHPLWPRWNTWADEVVIDFLKSENVRFDARLTQYAGH